MKKFAALILVIILIGLWRLLTQIGSNFQGDDLVLASDRDHTTENILRSTVRVHLQAWRMVEDESGFYLDESIGHATLRDDNVLVTHNHYPLLEEQDLVISVAFFATDGRPLFFAPLRDFEIRQAGPETLHFVLKHDFLAQKLDESGIIPAQFADWQDLNLQPGSTVAQIDWDGKTSRVDWISIEQVIDSDGVPRLVVDDGVMQGASGGGLFVDGRHIANNWQSIERLDGAGNLVYSTGVAAFNED